MVFLSNTPGNIILVPVNYDDYLLQHWPDGRVKIAKMNLNIAFTNDNAFINEIAPEKLWIPLEVVDANVNYVCPNNTGGAAGGSTGGVIFLICVAFCFFKNKDKIINRVQGMKSGLSFGDSGIHHTDDGQEMVGENMNIT